MPPKKTTPEGELTAPELRKLIRAHNILSKITIPKGTDRQGLIKLIEGKKYKIDHKNKVIKPQQQRGKQITLKNAEELTKPKPVSEAVKKQRAEKKKEKEEEKKKEIKIAKKEAVQEFKKKQKEAQKKKPAPKPKVMKKEDEVRPKEKTGRPRVDPKKKKVIEPKKEEPKPRRKLKGRLTGVRDKETARIEKEIPEFYAPDKERDNKSNKIKQDIILSYRKIKSSGDKELIKQARELLEQSKSRVRVEKDITFNQDLLSILKNINQLEKKPKKEVKKEEPKKEVKKEEPKKEVKKEEPKKKLNKQEEAFNKSGIIPAVRKQIGKLVEEWEKVRPELLKTLQDKDGNPIKKVKGGKRPLFTREKDKAQKEAYKVLKEIFKKGGYAQPSRNSSDDLFNLDIRSWEIYGGLPTPQLKKIATDRRNKKIEEIRARKEARKKAEENK